MMRLAGHTQGDVELGFGSQLGCDALLIALHHQQLPDCDWETDSGDDDCAPRENSRRDRPLGGGILMAAHEQGYRRRSTDANHERKTDEQAQLRARQRSPATPNDGRTLILPVSRHRVIKAVQRRRQRQGLGPRRTDAGPRAVSLKRRPSAVAGSERPMVGDAGGRHEWRLSSVTTALNTRSEIRVPVRRLRQGTEPGPVQGFR